MFHCSNSGTKTKASLDVLHKHGPCSQLNNGKAKIVPTHSDILDHDKERVNYIHSKLLSSKNNLEGLDSKSIKSRKSANLPAKSGSLIGSGNYFVVLGLGTPKKDLSLIFDTGSDLTWTQCQPCVGSCYKQQDEIYDPSKSTSYYNITCTSSDCTQLSSATGIYYYIIKIRKKIIYLFCYIIIIGILISFKKIIIITGNDPRCAKVSNACIYGIQYGDQSFSVGYFSRERLTVMPTDAIDGFLFGCGQDNEGLFGGSAGLLGLGRHPISFVQQTSQKYQKTFSYCLPSTSSGVGHLTFGASDNKYVKYTSFSTVSRSNSFYGLDIAGISVGGTKLPISSSIFSSGGAIIDSGTVITRLPPTAYASLRDYFKKGMTKYPVAPAVSILDTCYDLSGYKIVSIPKISFFLGGGVTVEIAAPGILYVASLKQACLAFSPNGDDSDITIFGNVQQRTLEVVYDVGGGKIGFGSNGCK